VGTGVGDVDLALNQPAFPNISVLLQKRGCETAGLLAEFDTPPRILPAIRNFPEKVAPD
jgi:hypothetical protein